MNEVKACLVRPPNGGHRLLFLILDPTALPEPNRKDADKECCVLFFDTAGE